MYKREPDQHIAPPEVQAQNASSKEIIKDNKGVIKDSKEVIKDSTEVNKGSKEVIKGSKEAITDSKEVITDSKEAIKDDVSASQSVETFGTVETKPVPAPPTPLIEPRWYSQQTIESFQPIRLLMLLTLRFPIRLRLNVVSKYEFHYKNCHLQTFLFLIVTGLIGIQGILIFINIFSHLTSFPDIKKSVPDYYKAKGVKGKMLTPEVLRAEESYIFRRHLISLIMTFGYICQGFGASIIIYTRRKFLCYFFSFIIEAGEITKINLGHGTKRFMLIIIIVWMIILALIILMFILGFAPITNGTLSVIVTMSYRVFYPAIHAIPNFIFRILRSVHSVLFFLILINSNIYVILFVWCCHVIRNGFVTWNGRIDQVLLRDERKKSNEERLIHRTTFNQIFHDHVVLLDLIQGVNRAFSGIIELFYISQVITLGFACYYLIRSQVDTSVGPRRLDGILLSLYIIMFLGVLFYVTWTPAEINDEAQEGFEIIRRRGFMGKKTDEELFFILSMHVSYTGHYEIAVVCGNYFTMDKTLFVTFLSSLCVFFIIIAQLAIPLQLQLIKDLKVLILAGRIADISSNDTSNPILWQTERGWMFSF